MILLAPRAWYSTVALDFPEATTVARLPDSAAYLFWEPFVTHSVY